MSSCLAKAKTQPCSLRSELAPVRMAPPLVDDLAVLAAALKVPKKG